MTAYQKLSHDDDLPHDGTCDHCSGCSKPCATRSRRSALQASLLCIGVLLLNALFWLAMQRHTTVTQPLQRLMSLQQDLLYETVQPSPDAWKDTSYNGIPSEQTDLAWSDIQEVRGVSLTPSEAKSFNLPDSSLKINSESDDTSTATILGFQHNLHCIRFLHQALYPDYYYPNQTDSDVKHRLVHCGHCLEVLRQSVQCTPDLTPMSVFWEDDERTNVAINPSAKRECVNWDSLVEWTRGRAYKLGDLWDANHVLVDDPKDDAAYKDRYGGDGSK